MKKTKISSPLETNEMKLTINSLIYQLESMNPIFLLRLDHDKHRIIICDNGTNKTIKNPKAYIDSIIETFNLSVKNENISKGITIDGAKDNVKLGMVHSAIAYAAHGVYTRELTMKHYANIFLLEVL